MGKNSRRSCRSAQDARYCVFPYFISNIYLMLFVGFVLMLIPYFFKG